MKICTIIPITTKSFMEAQKASRIEAAQGVVQVDVIHLNEGPKSIETSKDEAMAVLPLIEAAKKAERDGYDGITIDCAADPGLRPVREAVSIPVCAAGESSYLMAMSLCSKFSAIAVMKSTKHIIEENIKKYGIESRVASVRVANVPVLELEGDEAYESILEQSKLAIKEGAGAITLGCTGMASDAIRLEKTLGIPVIDPGAAAIQMLVSILLADKKTSKLDY